MRVTIPLPFVFIVIGLCLFLMLIGSEAYPNHRNGVEKCPPTCSIYCPCGHVLDGHRCPMCRCRPSNLCTGRHPNAHPRQRPAHGKSQILY